jgi:ABC-2 type transport system permease protein
MKLIDITIKDLIQSSRNKTIFFFMFVVPIGISLLFMIMFGGANDEGFQLPTIKVIIVNLDEGILPNLVAPSISIGGGEPGSPPGIEEPGSMGEILAGILQSEELAGLMEATESSSVASARAAVDNQEAGVAVILPANFTDSLIQPGVTSTVELYRDPTLTISPLIVEAIIGQILDNFDAAKIGLEVTMGQLGAAGLALNATIVQEIVEEFTAAFSEQDGGGSGDIVLVSVQPPPGAEEESDLLGEIVGTIMGGMMVFFAFYTGAAALETILTEEERGTLARLFTTPTSHRAILGGKGLAGIITLTIQITVLISFGALVMNVDWGAPASVFLAALGIVLIAAATGMFLVSMMKNTRQGGVIFGGVLTMTGMLGLIPVFTAGVPNQPEALKIVSLIVPQGWAMRNLTLAMEGATVQEMLPVFGGILIWTLAFVFIGQHRMRKRFA